MDSRKLTEYIGAVMELEKYKYTLENIYEQLNKEINTNKPYPVQRPTQPIAPVPVQNSKNGCVMAIVAVLLIFFTMGILIQFLSGEFGTIAMAMICPIIIVAVLIKRKYDKKANEKLAQQRYLKYKADYEKALKKYNIDISNYNEQQSKIKLELKNKQNELKQPYQEICDLLEKHYALNIVPQKYRELVPICMFYEYLSNKRTYSLHRNASDPGAINMYEEEKDRKIIQTKLNSIIDDLSIIQHNQSKLYYAIQTSQAETMRVMESINSGINESNNRLERNNRALEYNNYLNEVQVAQNTYRNNLLYYGY